MHPRRFGYAAFALGWLVVACSSTHSGTAAREGSVPAPAPVAARLATRPAATIDSAAFAQDADGARVVLNADAPLLYTSYEPAPDTLVIELSGARPADSFVSPAVEGALVTHLKVEPIDELGRRQTRLTIQHRAGAKFEIASQGRSLAIGFESPLSADASGAGAAIAEAPAATPVPSAEIQSSAAAKTPEVTSIEIPASAVAAATPPANVPRGEAAHALERVDISGTSKSAIVSLLGDGALTVSDFALENPPRIVLDVAGVRSDLRQRVIAGAGPVLRARVSQFRSTPDRVARVVIDLDRVRLYSIERDGERLLVRLGDAPSTAVAAKAAPQVVAKAAPELTAKAAPDVAAKAAPDVAAKAAPELTAKAAPDVVAKAAPENPVKSAPTSPVSRTTVAQARPEPAALPETTVTASKAPEAPAAVAPESTSRPVEMPKPAVVAAAVASPKPAQDSATKTEEKPEAPAGSLTRFATGATVETIPASKRAHGVLEAKKISRAKPAESRAAAPARSVPAPKVSQDPLFESAEVMLNAQEHPTDRQELANTYKSKTVGGGETAYTGEPISLDLKDADIKDVFRTISELTGLNIVIDPDVRGTVTVRLENVPWDQALELILKQNGLGYIIENNVMRIATTGKLQNEEQQRAALDLARQSSLPTKTVIKRLSYATAGTAAGTLKRVMSPRGDVIVDERTNTLIIREISDYMPTVLQLLENLDRPTDQVVIESRIVETTKTFGHTLGVNWGFSGIADAAHGNTTNLVFPNNGSIAGTVFTRPNGGAQPSTTGLALRLGNILDTFNLDIALNAAENQGLVKIISSPRVAAMTNQRASIQTGLQIPVQTTVNNTTSVVYVDATLQLQVTPQITAEGTILMDVNIQKREPAPGVQIQGGGNVPLSIRQAQTKIIVKDGGTAVIGGIFQMNDNDSYNYVPGLGKIPIIGNLFRTKQKLENHDELLIFITPRIIH